MEEIWKEVADWPDWLVSTCGRAQRKTTYKKTKAMQPTYGFVSNDYVWVCLTHPEKYCLEKRMAHLVLETFSGPKPSRDSKARHLDDIKTNNQLSNLAWGTSKENSDDAIRNGRPMGWRNCSPERHLAITLKGVATKRLEGIKFGMACLDAPARSRTAREIVATRVKNKKLKQVLCVKG